MVEAVKIKVMVLMVDTVPRGADHGNNDSSKQNPELSADEEAANKKALEAPPKAGEDHEKTINGSRLQWCGGCGYWGEHKIKDHPGGKATNEGHTKKDNVEGKGAMESNF